MNTYHMSREKRIKQNKISYKNFIQHITNLEENHKADRSASNLLSQSLRNDEKQIYTQRGIRQKNIQIQKSQLSMRDSKNTSFVIRQHQDGKLYTFCDIKHTENHLEKKDKNYKSNTNNFGKQKNQLENSQVLLNKQNLKSSLNQSIGMSGGFQGKFLKTEEAESQKKYLQNSTNKQNQQNTSTCNNRSCKKIQGVKKAYISIKSRSGSKNSKQNKLGQSVTSAQSSASKNSICQSDIKRKITLNIGNIKKSAELSIKPCRNKLTLDDKSMRQTLLDYNNNACHCKKQSIEEQNQSLLTNSENLHKNSKIIKENTEKSKQISMLKSNLQNQKSSSNKYLEQNKKLKNQMKTVSSQNQFLKKDCFRLAAVVQQLKEKYENLISQNQDCQTIISEVKRQNTDLKECLAFKKKEVDHLKQDLNKYIEIIEELRQKQKSSKQQSIENIGYFIKEKFQKYQLEIEQLQSQNDKLFLIKEKLQNYNRTLKEELVQKDQIIAQYYTVKRSQSQSIMNQSSNNFMISSRNANNNREEKLVNLIKQIEGKLKLSNIHNQYLTSQILTYKKIIQKNNLEQEQQKLRFNKKQRSTKQFTRCQENQTRYSDPFSIFTSQNESHAIYDQHTNQNQN